MKALWILTRQRLLDVLRNKSSTGFVLLFPLVLMLVTGVIFMHGHPFELRRLAVVGGGCDGAIGALADYEEIRIDPVAHRAEADGRLRARMASGVLSCEPELVVTVGPRDRLFGEGLAAATGARLERAEIPTWGYVHYLFAGLVAFSVIVSSLFATGYTLVVYRQNRFLKRLATTPLPKTTFVAAIVGARGALIFVQIALMAIAAALVFGVAFGGVAVAWFVLIVTLGIATFMGIGFALACLIKSEDMVSDVINAVNMPLILLSEIFFPLDALPGPLAWIGDHLPSTEMVRLLRAVLLYDVTDATALAPGLLLLAAWAVVTFAASLAAFRWHA